MNAAHARVLLLAGPSGSGKSYVARRTGLPVLCLDDFYREAGDPLLPLRSAAPGQPGPGPVIARPASALVDWESPLAWDADAALRAIEELCRSGRAETPVYAFGQDRRVGRHVIELGEASVFVAEGIFAAEILAECRARGLLAGAYTLRRPRALTYVRRLARDLTEARKPPAVLLRRGVALLRAEPAVLARQIALGAEPASARAVLARAGQLRSASRTPA